MSKLINFIILIYASCLLAGCSHNEIKDDFFAMDTYMNVTVYGSKEDADAARSEIQRLDGLLSRDRIDLENSEVKALIQEAKKIGRFTNGAFDISVAPLVELWGFHDKKYNVPSHEEIQNVLNTPSEEVDFGGIGKGYAGRLVREVLISRGVKSAIISLGGNVQTVGARPDGEPWKVGIQNPDGEGYKGYVSVKDMAVVTSGGYQRYFEADGKKYTHIIDSKTGYPADTDIKSATVICADGALADALSTAFYVMGAKDTEDFCRRVQCKYEETDFSVIIIDETDTAHCFGMVDYTQSK